MAKHGGEAQEGEACYPAHPLLTELRGIVHLLKTSSQPIKDGHCHLIPFCETLEAIFRDGLKQPNSLFGLNKQDYWCWIQPLQDYYFNEKQNPLLRQMVQAIDESDKIKTLQGRGRCFIRMSLCNKLISVPIEHLVRNNRLTQYWYSSTSVIATPPLRAALMGLLFEVTALDFALHYMKSSFLDETWIIPQYIIYKLPPVKTLDLLVAHIDGRALVVGVDEDSLAGKAGVEVWDVLDELCGEAVRGGRVGKLQKLLTNKSVDKSELTVVKKYLSDGSPFASILQRQLRHTQLTAPSSPSGTTPTSSLTSELLNMGPSSLINSTTESVDYSIVYVGVVKMREDRTSQELIDSSVTQVLTDMKEPVDVSLCVSERWVRLLNSNSSAIILQCSYPLLRACGRCSQHGSFLVLLSQPLPGQSDCEQGELQCYVCEAPSPEMAECICAHIAQGFNKQLSSYPVPSPRHSPSTSSQSSHSSQSSPLNIVHSPQMLRSLS